MTRDFLKGLDIDFLILSAIFVVVYGMYSIDYMSIPFFKAVLLFAGLALQTIVHILPIYLGLKMLSVHLKNYNPSQKIKLPECIFSFLFGFSLVLVAYYFFSLFVLGNEYTLLKYFFFIN